MSNVQRKLGATGVFKGAHGLEGLADAQEFWDKQPYGTRLYYGDGGLDYLHRGVLRGAIQALGCSDPNCADGMVPSMPDGEPEPCPKCNATAILKRIAEELQALNQSDAGAVRWVVTNCLAMARGALPTGVKP